MRSIASKLAAGVAASALMVGILAGGTLLAEQAVESRLRADLAAMGLSVTGVTIDLQPISGRAVVSGLEASGPRGSVSVGHASVALAPIFPAFIAPAQAREDHVLQDITLSWSPVVDFGITVTVPRLSIAGSDASRGDWLALFDANAPMPLVQRINRLSASAITAPEVKLVQAMKDGTNTIIHRDMAVTDLRNGRAASLVLASADTDLKLKDGKGPGESVSGTYGRMEVRGLNLGLKARLYAEAGKAGDPLEVLYESYQLGRSEFRLGTMGTYSIGGVSGGSMKARPLTVPIAQLLAMAERLSAGDGPPGQADKRQLFTMLADAGDAFEGGRSEIRDLVMDAKQPQPVRLRMGSAVVGPFGAGRMEEFSFNDMEFSGPEAATFKLGSLGMTGLSMRSFFSSLGTADFEDPASLNPRDFIPQLDAFRISNVSFNMPDANDKQRKARIVGSLGNFEVRLGNYINAIPANVAITVERAAADLPKNSRDSGLQQLIAMGYSRIEASSAFKLRYDEAGKALMLDEFSTKLADMGALTARASIGNVSRDIFDTDLAKMSVAGLAAQVRTLDLRLDNAGLVQKALAEGAKQQRKKPDDFRAELSAGAALLIPGMMGDHPAAKTVANAVAKFIAAPKSLSIGLRARGEGLSAADFMAVSSPAQLLDRVDITATAD
jgi:hypothetical protein